MEEIRRLQKSEEKRYNDVVKHPLQSWQWGAFREKTGLTVVRRGLFNGRKMVDGFQLTIHPLPYIPYTVGYVPKSSLPNKTIIDEIKQIGRYYNCVFIKFEPNIEQSKDKKENLQLTELNLKPSPHPLFTKYTFQIDLAKSEDDLFQQMNQKTRYNVRLAQRKGVVVKENNSPDAFRTYLHLSFETTQRQGFYAHDEHYHKLMWKTLGLSHAPIAHLLTAEYKGKIIVTWILFLFNGVLYYPYGASSNKHREVMASNLMMLEAMLWGKKHGAKLFDLWGSLGHQPDKNDSWYGFHRFKQGYRPRLVEFIGSWDLVLHPFLYRFYNLANTVRWALLKK